MLDGSFQSVALAVAEKTKQLLDQRTGNVWRIDAEIWTDDFVLHCNVGGIKCQSCWYTVKRLKMIGETDDETVGSIADELMHAWQRRKDNQEQEKAKVESESI